MTVRSFILDTDIARNGFIALLGKLNLSKPWLVELSDDASKRSLEQNKRYWALLRDLADAEVNERTYSPDVWHEWFKLKFNPVEAPDGAVVGGTTTKMGVKKFGEYMLSVESWAASEHGIVLGDW